MSEITHEESLNRIISSKKSKLLTVCLYSSNCESCMNFVSHVETVRMCLPGIYFHFVDLIDKESLKVTLKIENVPFFIFYKQEVEIGRLSTLNIVEFIAFMKSLINVEIQQTLPVVVKSLTPLIIKDNVQVMNCKEDREFCSSLFQRGYLESIENEKIILYVPFVNPVALKKILLSTPSDGCPRKILLYKNLIDFKKEDVEILIPNEEVYIDSKSDNKEVVEIAVHAEEFKSVSNIVLYIENRDNCTTSIINKLWFYGSQKAEPRILPEEMSQYGLVKRRYGVQFNIKRQQLQNSSSNDVVVVIFDTNIAQSPVCQETIRKIEERLRQENKIARFVFPYMVLYELQISKDLAIPGQTVEEKRLRRLWENASARFIIECLKKENFFVQSSDMMELFEEQSKNDSQTADECILRCAIQQNQLNEKPNRVVILTLDKIEQLFSFAHMIFAYDCNDIDVLLKEREMSVTDIILTDPLALQVKPLNYSSTERTVRRRTLRFMESTFITIPSVIDSIWKMKGIVSNNPMYLCAKDKVLASLKEKLSLLKSDHTSLLQIVIWQDASLPEETKKIEFISGYDALCAKFYDLERKIASPLESNFEAKKETLTLIEDLKSDHYALLEKVDENGMMRKCPDLKEIPYNLAIDSRRSWQKVINPNKEQ